MKINNEVIKEIRKSDTALIRLITGLGIKYSTLYKWLQNKDDNDLTKVKAIKIIANELNIPEEGIVTEDGTLSKEQFELVKSIYEKQGRELDECFKCETN
jgi:transcriptional regulator with XRE-family HTH domain